MPVATGFEAAVARAVSRYFDHVAFSWCFFLAVRSPVNRSCVKRHTYDSLYTTSVRKREDGHGALVRWYKCVLIFIKLEIYNHLPDSTRMQNFKAIRRRQIASLTRESFCPFPPSSSRPQVAHPHAQYVILYVAPAKEVSFQHLVTSNLTRVNHTSRIT